MLEAIIKHLKRDERGVSNVIVVMLSLPLIVVIVANVVLWSYQMNQFDWERMQENLEIVDVARMTNSSARFTFQNNGSLTSHLVSLWVNNSTHHQRYDVNIFVNSGDRMYYIRGDISLPNKPYTVKVVTERGNTAVFASH